MSLSVEERSKHVQRRQGTPGCRVLNSRVAGMISCNVDAEHRCHRVITSDTRWSCWPGNHEPYCVGSDIPAHKACIQSSQGHATNEAARAAE